MFFYDEKLQTYESLFSWDEAISYLEDMYSETDEISVLNSLIGFSWYYLFEGPSFSKKYENDESRLAPIIWKKYIDHGLQNGVDDPSFFYIAGYTLSMDGYFLGKRYGEMGPVLMEKCAEISRNPYLQKLANHFLINQHTSGYVPIATSNLIITQLFAGDSLLEKLFRELLESSNM